MVSSVCQICRCVSPQQWEGEACRAIELYIPAMDMHCLKNGAPMTACVEKERSKTAGQRTSRKETRVGKCVTEAKKAWVRNEQRWNKENDEKMLRGETSQIIPVGKQTWRTTHRGWVGWRTRNNKEDTAIHEPNAKRGVTTGVGKQSHHACHGTRRWQIRRQRNIAREARTNCDRIKRVCEDVSVSDWG